MFLAEPFLMSLITFFSSSRDINLCWDCEHPWKRDAACAESPEDEHKYEGGQPGSDQTGLHLEKGLAWSLTASGKSSLAWHGAGHGQHVSACHVLVASLLYSTMKKQEMRLWGRGGGQVTGYQQLWF